MSNVRYKVKIVSIVKQIWNARHILAFFLETICECMGRRRESIIDVKPCVQPRDVTPNQVR